MLNKLGFAWDSEFKRLFRRQARGGSVHRKMMTACFAFLVWTGSVNATHAFPSAEFIDTQVAVINDLKRAGASLGTQVKARPQPQIP